MVEHPEKWKFTTVNMKRAVEHSENWELTGVQNHVEHVNQAKLSKGQTHTHTQTTHTQTHANRHTHIVRERTCNSKTGMSM